MQQKSYIDYHAHVWGTGYKVLHPRLDDARSVADVFDILRPSLLNHHGGFLTARGWDQNKWGQSHFPTREDLDALSTDIPIALTRVDGHAMWCNSNALEVAGITRSTTIPPGGDILKTSSGEPTGILLDDAMGLVHRAMPPDDDSSITRTLRAGLDEFAKHHIGVHDMGIPAEWWEPYKKLYASDGDSLINADVFLDMSKQTGRALFLQKLREERFDDSPHPKLRLVGIKLYLDGALGSRGAELFEDYSDDPGNRGLSLTSDEEALELMTLAAGAGLGIAIHAIGDKANARALDLFAKTPHPLHPIPNTLPRRIEHTQIVREQDLPRFRELGVAAVIQPQFFASDRHWAIKRLGPERMKNAYRWKSLVDAGATVLASSDSPVEEANANIGIELLQTRDGVEDGEAVTREEAEKMYMS
ncbi:MAG: amidohydrolase [Bacteroidetes bacterium]|nr:amidohydrolase [Bacteroidota bacterium]